MQSKHAFPPSSPSKVSALAIGLGTGAMMCSLLGGLHLFSITDFGLAVNRQREPVRSEGQFVGPWTCITTMPDSGPANATRRIVRQSHITFDGDLSFEEDCGDFSAGGDWFFDQSAIVLRYVWQNNDGHIEWKPHTMRLVVRKIDDSHFSGENADSNRVSHFRRLETVRFGAP